MQRAKLNFLVDAVACVAFVFLVSTGMLMRYKLPPATGNVQTLWGLERHGWGDVHFWIGVVLLGTLAIHLLLHWRWIVSMIRGQPRKASGFRVGLAVVGVLGLLAMAAAPFLGQTREERKPPRRMRSTQEKADAAVEVTGAMTLREIEARTGVSCETILRALNLPSDIPHDEQLGRLRRRYGFTMSAVRQAVRESMPKQ